MKAAGTGFTLLEVLIALAILAISATAIVGQTSNSLAQLSVLEQKTAAALLAESQIDKLIAAGEFPSLGRASEEVTVNGVSWLVTVTVDGTTEPWLRRITVSVSDPSNPDFHQASLVSYRGKF